MQHKNKIKKLLNRNIDIENEGTENEIKSEMSVDIIVVELDKIKKLSY